MAEEKAEEKKEKQTPEKPKPRGGGGGSISMITLIGIISGTVVVMVGILTVVFYMFILPDLKGHGGESDSTGNEHVKIKEESQSSENSFANELKEEDIVLGDKGTHMIETGKIIANPKGSTKFAVVNLALDFRVSEKDERFEPEAEITAENPIINKLLIMVNDKINAKITSLTVDDFYNMGSDSLRNLFKQELNAVFLKNKLFLREVYLKEYLIQ